MKDLSGVVSLRVNIHQDVDALHVARMIESLGVKITKTCDTLVNYVECSADASAILHIANIREVHSIHIDGEKQTFMNLITSNVYIGNSAVQLGGFSGQGMLAEVQDNGIDRLHPDLANVIYTDGSVVADSHGTCTAGIVFGTGAGNSDARGITYDATGVFADWSTGRTTSIQNLWNGNFNEGSAGMNGVIQSNSWSQGSLDGQYTAYSNEDDVASVNYPHVLSLWALGNSNGGTGIGLITQDSANKNGMAIGAIFHENTAAMNDDNYRDAGMGMTPSRGPAADGRMKPDLVAAFDWILTVDQRGSAGYSSTDYYDDFGGTSGATPIVAGSSLQAYQMYKENFFGNNPSNVIPYSSTIKALMIANAYQYPLGVNSITRNVQGWGTPDMENMYNLGADYNVIEEYPQALSAGDSWSRTVYSDGTVPLKITIAWIDPAAPSTTGASRALINNLDLKVSAPDGTVYWGNNGLWDNLYSTSGTGINTWSTSGSYRDDLNNVENVFIDSPGSGIWTVEVMGRDGEVPQGPQEFSMVASGAQGISSMGTIVFDRQKYISEDFVQVTVQDMDLNTDPNTVQTVAVNVASILEPAGETLVLTETGADTSTFVGTIMLSSTNSAGVLWVSLSDTITATYNDADNGMGSPAVVTATAVVDSIPPGPPSSLTVEWYGMARQTIFFEDFEGDGTPTFAELGWIISGINNDWQIGTPMGLGGEYGNPDPNSAHSGSFSIGNDLTGIGTYPGDYEPNLFIDANRIRSPAIDCTGHSGVSLSFWRYLNVESSTYDRAYVEVSNDGASFSTVWTNSATITDSAWSEVSYDISAVADGQPTVYIRFGIGPTDGSWQYSGWNIDDLSISGLTSGTMHNTLNWTLSSDDGSGDDDVSH
ncbi:MAG: S8 family serine peptidase, partial [Candidatus Thermoplasmatota archaeon]|nr:S8 family serine peptidase [Candidatus Thermoplasmatota archaeon]